MVRLYVFFFFSSPSFYLFKSHCSFRFLFVLLSVANADIFFDNSLVRLCKSPPALVNLTNKVFALGTWAEKTFPDDKIGLSLTLRTDSQDAWIFRPPLSPLVSSYSDFNLGAVRADNVLAAILAASGYEVSNPMFGIHAIESDRRHRQGNLYDVGGAAFGPVSNVLLSDKLTF